MRFSVASVLALASVVLAQTNDNPTVGFNAIIAPANGEKVAAGKSYPIVWAPDATHPGAITIQLYGGPAQDKLNIVETVATGVDGAAGTFPWPVASTLGSEKIYGFKITLESNTTVWQWGNPFSITGSKDSASSSASASASASASGSATVSASRSTSVSASSTASSTKVSATVTSTTVSESSKATSTFTRISSSIYSNSTVTHVTDATVTTFTTGTASRGTATSTSTSSIATNGVAAMGANGLALFGGFAMAVLAL